MSRKTRNKKQEPAARFAAAGPTTAARPATERRVGERTWLEQAWRRASRIVGSLQVAVILLAIFATVLALGTMAESWYNSRVAQELVYQTWWFQLLLLLLGANILFAALKKWPWKKHQTGFLITHLGLLTMVAGGMWNAWSGTDAFVVLADTDDKSLLNSHGLEQSERQMILQDQQQIIVRRVAKDERSKEDKGQAYVFAPGSLPWRSDNHLDVQLPAFTSVLSWLAHPLPRYWSRETGDGATLTVENAYPHTRIDPFSPASRSRSSFPAFRVQLWSAQMGRVPPFWLALSSAESKQREWPHHSLGPAMAELVGRCDAELLNEFLQPPNPEELGPKGQLVVDMGGRLQRMPIEANLGRLVPLGNSGSSIRVTRFQPVLVDSRSERTEPADPVVYFEVSDKQGNTAKYLGTSRMNSRGGALDSRGEPGAPDPLQLKYWYHPPDHRYGRGSSMRGLLQFAQTPDGKLHYRAFHQDAGAFRVESAGLAMNPDVGLDVKSEVFSIWKGMKWRFQILGYLPAAADQERIVPENHRPGLHRPEDLRAAIRGKLKHKGSEAEFWAALGRPAVVSLGGERFNVMYTTQEKDLGFEIKLLRAEQQVDDGAQSAATYTSFVQVTDEGKFSHPSVPQFLRPVTSYLGLTWGGVEARGEDHVITMNEPLGWGGFKVYQSDYKLLDYDSRERPVNRSGFTIGRDPGMFLKYLGSSMLALGIACMFYMKAYFVTGRKRPIPPTATNGQLVPEEKS